MLLQPECSKYKKYNKYFEISNDKFLNSDYKIQQYMTSIG